MRRFDSPFRSDSCDNLFYHNWIHGRGPQPVGTWRLPRRSPAHKLRVDRVLWYTVQVTSRSRTEDTAMEITLQIPEKLGFLLPKREVLSRELLEAYAADAYRNEKLTRHEVGQLLGLDRWQSEDFLARRQAQRPFGSEDMDLERASFRRG